MYIKIPDSKLSNNVIITDFLPCDLKTEKFIYLPTPKAIKATAISVKKAKFGKIDCGIMFKT